jgi:hypothetical protein
MLPSQGRGRGFESLRSLQYFKRGKPMETKKILLWINHRIKKIGFVLGTIAFFALFGKMLQFAFSGGGTKKNFFSEIVGLLTVACNYALGAIMIFGVLACIIYMVFVFLRIRR